jgi:hypothetical protein
MDRALGGNESLETLWIDLVHVDGDTLNFFDGFGCGKFVMRFGAGQVSQMAWPRVISLTHNTYDRFLNDAIPIPAAARSRQ